MAKPGRKPKPVRERFEAMFIPVPECGCWLWMGALSTRGYGHFRMRDKNGRRVVATASRVAYELYVGSADGMFVCHRCDNPACVNPDHLFIGTNEDNVRDRVEKGRSSRYRADWTHCKNGHEYTDANIRMEPYKRGGEIRYTRRCITCTKEKERRRVARNRNARLKLTPQE